MAPVDSCTRLARHFYIMTCEDKCLLINDPRGERYGMSNFIKKKKMEGDEAKLDYVLRVCRVSSWQTSEQG